MPVWTSTTVTNSLSVNFNRKEENMKSAKYGLLTAALALQFLAVAAPAQGVKPGQGYADQVAAYKSGKHDGLDLRELALAATKAGDRALAKEVATPYLAGLSREQMMGQKNAQFMAIVGDGDSAWEKKVTQPFISRLTP